MYTLFAEIIPPRSNSVITFRALTLRPKMQGVDWYPL